MRKTKGKKSEKGDKVNESVKENEKTTTRRDEKRESDLGRERLGGKARRDFDDFERDVGMRTKWYRFLDIF